MSATKQTMTRRSVVAGIAAAGAAAVLTTGTPAAAAAAEQALLPADPLLHLMADRLSQTDATDKFWARRLQRTIESASYQRAA